MDSVKDDIALPTFELGFGKKKTFELGHAGCNNWET